MPTITTSGPSNWRELFEGHPGLAVTPENHDRLLAAQEAAAAPAPAPVPEEPRPAPRTPPRRVPPAAEVPGD